MLSYIRTQNFTTSWHPIPAIGWYGAAWFLTLQPNRGVRSLPIITAKNWLHTELTVLNWMSATPATSPAVGVFRSQANFRQGWTANSIIPCSVPYTRKPFWTPLTVIQPFPRSGRWVRLPLLILLFFTAIFTTTRILSAAWSTPVFRGFSGRRNSVRQTPKRNVSVGCNVSFFPVSA